MESAFYLAEVLQEQKTNYKNDIFDVFSIICNLNFTNKFDWVTL